MRKIILIDTTVMGAAVLSASPISVQWSADRNLSVSPDKAFAVVGRPRTPGTGGQKRHQQKSATQTTPKAEGLQCRSQKHPGQTL